MDDAMMDCDECADDAIIEWGNVADGAMTGKKSEDKGSSTSPDTIFNAKHARNRICINKIIGKKISTRVKLGKIYNLYNKRG